MSTCTQLFAQQPLDVTSVTVRLLCRYCSQNPDPSYNSCNVPQEMSNEAIDHELEGGSQALLLLADSCSTMRLLCCGACLARRHVDVVG